MYAAFHYEQYVPELEQIQSWISCCRQIKGEALRWIWDLHSSDDEEYLLSSGM
jgi:hypothetical protein